MSINRASPQTLLEIGYGGGEESVADSFPRLSLVVVHDIGVGHGPLRL